MSRRSLSFPILLALSIAAPSVASAQGECVSPARRQAVLACPPTAPAGHREGRATVPAPHLPPTKQRPTQAPPPRIAPTPIEADLRAGRRESERRGVELMRREVETTERILSRMGEDDPRAAEYLLRLATTQIELQTHWNAEERSLDEPIFVARQRGDATEVAALERRQRAAHAELERAREDAIRAFARLVQHHPDFPRIDEALFQLAFGLEELGQHDRARQVYFRLIRSHPTSRFIPHAYLAFAEHSFEEDQMDEARQFYERVLEIPPERNPVYGYALYKLAWVRVNLEDFRGALAEFARTIEHATEHEGAPDAQSLARQARRELVLPYARIGNPRQALPFFRRYAQSPEQAFEMLESLGELYEDTGQWPETIQVHHQLMAELPASDRLCAWQARVTHAVISSRPKPEQVLEAQRLVDVQQAFGLAGHPRDAIDRCRSDAAGVLVELATAWHREAVGTDEQPGTNDRRTMQLAAEVYDLLLASFPDLDAIAFPDIDRRDTPTTYRVSYFRAELAWRMDDHEACGPAFDRVVELDPRGELTEDAAYASVLCYNALYAGDYAAAERQRRAAGSLARQELTPLEVRMLESFRRFVCFAPESEERATVQYRRARIHYQANQFEEASVLFEDVATRHADHDLGEIAANLYLDSLAALAPADASEDAPARDGNRACYDELAAALDPLHGAYCATEDASDAHDELCGIVRGLRCNLVRVRAETLAREGDHRGAIRAYRTILAEHRECPRVDEVVYNLAIEYEAARLLGQAIRARTTLIERFPSSPLVPQATYLVGASYHALAIYSQAAEWYERFARTYPTLDGSQCTERERAAGTCAIAHEALESATFFRLGLGEEERAAADVELYERSFRRARPRETAQVVLSLGSIYERQGDWGRVFSHYHGWIREHGRQALPHEIARAHVQLGRATWESGDHDQAVTHFRAAVSAWERGEPALARAPGTEAERATWTARGREAASEALFHLAELEREAFDAVRFPRVPATRTIVSVNRWATHDLVPWLTRKIAALDRARAAYDRVAPLGNPQWQIAAAARLGEMYQSIVDDVRTSPVPEEIERDEELYAIYVDALEAVLNGSTHEIACTPESTEDVCVRAPIHQARASFERCLTTATSLRWFSEWSRACEVALHDHDAQRYPIASELRGTASFVPDRLAPPSPTDLEERDPGGPEESGSLQSS